MADQPPVAANRPALAPASPAGAAGAVPAAGCSNFYGATYFKYGVRPPSRYASYIWASGCAGTSHVIRGTLPLNGVDISTAATPWVG